MSAPSYRRPSPGSGKPFECETCTRRFSDARSLRQHAKAVHALTHPTCAEVPPPASVRAS